MDAKLKAGLYGVVRSLLRVLEKGVIGKLILDTVLDACSAMQVGLAAVLGLSVGLCSALGTCVVGFGGWMWWEGVVRSLQLLEKG